MDAYRGSRRYRIKIPGSGGGVSIVSGHRIEDAGFRRELSGASEAGQGQSIRDPGDFRVCGTN